MADDDGSFKDKVRNSFSKVKEDTDNLLESIESIKIDLKNKSNDISTLNSNLNEIKTDLSKIKDILNDFKNVSTGNKGVSAQWRTMAHNEQQRTMAHNTSQKTENITNIPFDLSKFEKNTLTLTDREFSVFIAIYELGKEQGYATYSLLAKRLNLTDSPIRHSVNRLLDKQMPLERERVLNGKVSLFIKEGILSQPTLSKIISLRQQYPDEQTTLKP